MRARHPLLLGLTLVVAAPSVPTGALPAQQREWKFEDDFSSQRGGWPTGVTPRGDEYGYANGKYRILAKVVTGQVAAGQIAGIPLSGMQFQILSVEADAVQRTGPAAVLHGIGCGTSAAEQYFFYVSPDGSYLIMREDAETGTADLLEIGRTAAIRRGIGATNRLRAKCIGGEQEARLILSVNGEKVAEARGETGESFDRTAFFVTTVQAVARSTQAVELGVSKERPGSPIDFVAEVLFDNFVLVGSAPLVIKAMPPMPDLSDVRTYAPDSSPSVDPGPSLLRQGELCFPERARTRGLQGWVVLDAIVGPDGRVEAHSARLVALSDSIFLEPAQRALMASEFIPGRKNGVPVRVLIRQPFHFTLGQ